MATPLTSTSEDLGISKYHITISPPLLNSSNPWATSYDDLTALYNCPYTGAITTRTALWRGFLQKPDTHQYTFFSTQIGHATAPIDTFLAEGRSAALPHENSSLNTLGYSPIPFPDYLKILINMSQAGDLKIRPAKPFIISVTGDSFEVIAAYTRLLEIQEEPETHRWKPDGDYEDLALMMEINLSCPNIAGTAMPGYDGAALMEYLKALAETRLLSASETALHVGIKIPPYTHSGQFQTLISCLEAVAVQEGGCPISFITATNTLGSCLVLDNEGGNALGSISGNGIGGMAGEALHPLALGNVRTIRRLLDDSIWDDVRRIAIIGVGGVSDRNGFERMRAVGAMAVGVGTALGREGVNVFEKISKGGV